MRHERQISELPKARSPSELRREMLRCNRLLGLHQLWWAVIFTPIALYLLDALGIVAWQWQEIPLAFGVALAGVELRFLPRRLTIQRMAREESRAEAVRLACQHGLALREVITGLADHRRG